MASETSRYRPLVKIASGGMASVWVGTRGNERVLFALKRPHDHLLEDPGFKRILVAEAAVASRLTHPNVVSARELDDSGGGIQIVMDYVDGPSLGQLLVKASKSDKRLPVSIAASVARDAARGLAALHGLEDSRGENLGYLHRDVSPQNILVSRDGVAKITDFGLAKCARGSEQPTTQGTLKGKLGYLAPEYIRGEPVDQRADVFALGIVLWESASGKRLFRGENDGETLDRVCRAEIPRLADASPEFRAVDEIAARALEREPSRRYRSARDLAEAIERVLPCASPSQVAAYVESEFGQELKARAAEIEQTLQQSQPKLRSGYWVLWVVAGLAAAGLWAGMQGAPSPGPAPVLPKVAEPTPVREPVIAPSPVLTPAPAATPTPTPTPHPRTPRNKPTKTGARAPSLPPNPYEEAKP